MLEADWVVCRVRVTVSVKLFTNSEFWVRDAHLHHVLTFFIQIVTLEVVMAKVPQAHHVLEVRVRLSPDISYICMFSYSPF